MIEWGWEQTQSTFKVGWGWGRSWCSLGGEGERPRGRTYTTLRRPSMSPGVLSRTHCDHLHRLAFIVRWDGRSEGWIP